MGDPTDTAAAAESGGGYGCREDGAGEGAAQPPATGGPAPTEDLDRKRRWAELTPPRAGTYAAEMVYQESAERMILFGGIRPGHGYSVCTWAWNGARWRKVRTETHPSAREDHAMAYDPVRDEIVLYGGWNEDQLNSTWIFKDGTWRSTSPADRPPNSQNHMMAFDPKSRQIILVTGMDEGFHPGETWAWDGTNWTELRPATVPPARSGGVLVLDPARNSLILFGGARGTTALTDTWRWDGTNWIEVEVRESPGRRFDAAAAPVGRHATIFGGGWLGSPLDDTWVLRKNSWRQVDRTVRPAARFGAAMAWDSVRREAILTGGKGAGWGDTDTWGYVDTWAFRH